MSLPENYIEGITRVSSLVEHQYPFSGTDAEKRYLGWLSKNNIQEGEYIKEACDVGTFVHLQMEKHIENEPIDSHNELFTKHNNEINYGFKFMADHGLVDMETEVYVRDKYSRYQGSIDLLATNADGKKVLIDWKTWGVAKKKFGLPNGKTKPYSKLKKVALQLSLYAKALGNIDEVRVVWLHEEGYFAYKLDMVEDDKLELLIMSHQTKGYQMPQDSHIIINYNPMRIEIQTVVPGQQYSKAAITLEKEDCDNGKTIEENITRAIEYQKALVGKYKEINGN